MVKNSDKLKILSLITIIVFGIIIPIIQIQAVDYTPVLRVSTEDVYLTAGIENQVKITITNVGSWNIYETKIAISVPATIMGISIVDGGHKVYNKIESEASKSFFVSVYIDESTPLGAYSLTFQATYMKKVQFGPEMLESTTLQLGIVVNQRPNLTLNVLIENPLLIAGADNELKIKLHNIGDKAIYDIDSMLMSSSPYMVILEGARFIHNKINSNQTIPHTVTLKVSRNTPLGGYILTEEVFYRDEDGLTHTESFVIGVKVNVSSRPNLILDVVIDEPRLTAGIENKVYINLTNIGDEVINNIDVTLTSLSPNIAILEGDRIILEELKTGQTNGFNANIAVSKNSLVGVYTLSATAKYMGQDGQDYFETYTIGIKVDSVEVPAQTSVVLRSYDTSLGMIKPGDSFELSLDLECIGAVAHDVKTVLTLDPLTGISTMSPTTLQFGVLEPSQHAEAIYELLIGGNVNAGQYPAIVTITYLDSDGFPKSLTETVTLSVRGIVNFKLINVEPSKVPVGTRTEFEADLLLIGTQSVKFVSIKFVEDSVFHHTTGSKEYIGAVDPDSPIPFDLWFEIPESTELGEHVLKLLISYEDDLNTEHEATLEIPLNVVSGTLDSDSMTSGWNFWAFIRRLLGLGP